MQLGQRSPRRLEGLAVGVTDPRHQVPVIAGRARQAQRRPRRHHPQPPLGVEVVGEADQVALVGAAAVVEDQQPLGVSPARPFELEELGH